MVHEPGGSGQNILGIIGKNSLSKEFFMLYLAIASKGKNRHKICVEAGTGITL